METGAKIILPVVVCFQRRGGPGGGNALQGRAAGDAAEQGLEEKQAADEARDRVSGQAQHLHGSDGADHQRFSRAHGDAPEIKLHAFGLQRRLHEIVVADRCAAECHQHVGLCRHGLADGGADQRVIVSDDAEIENVGSGSPGKGRDPEGVRGDDLRRLRRASGRQQFVAGGKDGDERPAIDGKRGMVHCRRDGEIGKTEFAPGLQNRFTLGKILSARANVSPCGDFEGGADFSALQHFGVFLNENGVGPCGNRRAGEDAHGLALPHRTCKSMAGGGLADDGENRADFRRVGAAQRIAVHGGSIERRLRQTRR